VFGELEEVKHGCLGTVILLWASSSTGKDIEGRPITLFEWRRCHGVLRNRVEGSVGIISFP
jgi:hypothetical protein